MKKYLYLLSIIILSVWSCEPENSSPTASFTITPSTGTIETIFTFDANGCRDKEDENSGLLVRWDWQNDGDWDTDWSIEKTATHQYVAFGDYEIRLEVKDSEGLTDITSNSISMSNTPPTALFTITPTEGETSTTFTFDASGCTDKEDDTSDLEVRWDWHNNGDWDDGFMTDKVITHQFTSVKNHIILMEVRDTEGLTDTLSLTLDVSVGCGAIITDDIILTKDFDCTAFDTEALHIRSSNITIDLGGFTISNNSQNRQKVGIDVQNVENVTIKNGSIEGFSIGMDVINSNNITIENVNITNAYPYSDIFVMGIKIYQCNDVNISGCSFEFPREIHKEAIVLYQSNINVDNVVFNGGSVGVNFSFVDDCTPGSDNHSNGGVVSNCLFNDIIMFGILIECSNNALISSNEFAESHQGIMAYGPKFGCMTNITIEENYIHDGIHGIVFEGTTESTIDNNIIENVWRGIMMDQCFECGEGNFTEPCFYSTGNIISNNILTGNTIDLEHHELAVGNTWINNTCHTKVGAEIPECTGK